jgi:EthD domain
VEKLVYLVWERPSIAPDALGARVQSELIPALLALEPKGLSVVVDDDAATTPAPVPVPDDELPIRLAVSIWLDTFDARAPFEAALASFGVRRAGYLVTESLCEDYGTTADWPEPRDWADGERSPGITVLTVFDKKPDLDDDTFYGHWYGHQTPMSAGMQPRVRYVRNAVVRGVTPGAPPLRAIVEEAWPTTTHLTDLHTFFGAANDQEMGENIRIMLDSMKVFTDASTLRTFTVSEYLLR